MKKIVMCVAIAMLLAGCVYRETVIIPDRKGKLGFRTYSLQTLEVENSRALFVPEDVVSNMAFSVFRLVMERNGYTLSQHAEVQVFLRITCLENDLLNNKQRILITMEFFSLGEPLALFSFFAEDKALMLDQRVLGREFQRAISLMRGEHQRYLDRKGKR